MSSWAPLCNPWDFFSDNCWEGGTCLQQKEAETLESPALVDPELQMLLVCGKIGRFHMKTFSSTSQIDWAILLLTMGKGQLQGHACARVNFKGEIQMGKSAVSGPKLQSMYQFMQIEISEELPSSQQYHFWQSFTWCGSYFHLHFPLHSSLRNGLPAEKFWISPTTTGCKGPISR